MLKNSLFTILTAFFSIIILFLLTKLIGKKQVSQLDIFDYVIGISFGSIAAEMATNIEEWYKPFIAMVVYAVVSCIISAVSCKSIKFRRFIVGNPTVLYLNGKIYDQNLKKAKIDLNEFLYLCRTNGYFDLSALYSIILEPNGRLSFLPISSQRPVNPTDMNILPKQELPLGNVIIDGNVMTNNLKNLGFDNTWLDTQLKLQNADKKNVFLATCDADGNLTVYEKQNKKNVLKIFN